MKNGNWTVEEYREFLRTGKEPAEKGRAKLVMKIAPTGTKDGYHAVIADEVNAWEEPKKRPKYGNQKVNVDGIPFDSKHEAAVYQQLMDRVKAGELKCVMRQVRFDLGNGPYADKESRYQYVADFVTVDPDNRVAVLDAKSEATRKDRIYINKKKQMQAEWGLEIVEV